MTEDQLEQETLGWLKEVGYTHLYGPDIAHDGEFPERDHYRRVVLVERLRSAIAKLNPKVPLAAREDALKQVLELGLPVQLSANLCSIVYWSAAYQCSTKKMVKLVAISYA